MKYLERITGVVVAALVAIVLVQPALAERGGERPTLDTDGDGYVSPEEYSASRLADRVEFAAMDTDGDNLLTKEEIRNYMQENRKGRGGRNRPETEG